MKTKVFALLFLELLIYFNQGNNKSAVRHAEFISASALKANYNGLNNQAQANSIGGMFCILATVQMQ